MSFEWKGVFPALTTKFTASDDLDLPLFEKNLQAQLAAGVEGIILGGKLGEASVLSSDEKEKLVKFEYYYYFTQIASSLNDFTDLIF